MARNNNTALEKLSATTTSVSHSRQRINSFCFGRAPLQTHPCTDWKDVTANTGVRFPCFVVLCRTIQQNTTETSLHRQRQRSCGDRENRRHRTRQTEQAKTRNVTKTHTIHSPSHQHYLNKGGTNVDMLTAGTRSAHDFCRSAFSFAF